MSYPADPASSAKSSLDAVGLADALRPNIRGEVRFDSSARALYATDGSNYRQVPIGVVVPRDADDVLAAISVCREFGAPLLCRGGGTSLAGQCSNVAVVLDFSKYMSAILEIDPTRRIARVQPGVVLDKLRNAAEKHHLTFAPDPASHDRCTIGGMIGNNSCGVHSVMAGKTDDNIESLEIVLYDGTRLKVGENFIRDYVGTDALPSRRPGSIGPQRHQQPIPCRSNPRRPTPNRHQLRRSNPPEIPTNPPPRLRIQSQLPSPRKRIPHRPRPSRDRRHLCHRSRSHLPPRRKSSARVLLVVAYSDIFQCADRIPEIMAHKPIGLEGFDDLLVNDTRTKGINSEGLSLLPEGGGWLLVELEAQSIPGAELQAQSLIDSLKRSATPPNIRLTPARRPSVSGTCANPVWA